MSLLLHRPVHVRQHSAQKKRLRACLSFLATTLLILLIGTGAARTQPTLALTFDDGFSTGPGATAAMLANASILETLRNNRIRAMLFPHGAMVDSPDSLSLIQDWSKAGHAIGNHTYSHGSLSATDTARYLADIDKAQHLFGHLPGWCPLLRFPYLDEGKTEAQRQALLEGLAQRGYGVAPATIMLPDWDYGAQYQALIDANNLAAARTFRENYINQVISQAWAQETHWRELLKRSPAHILLLHANSLNADALPTLVQTFRQQGWVFDDPLKALKDPIYQRPLVPAQNGQPARALPVPDCR